MVNTAHLSKVDGAILDKIKQWLGPETDDITRETLKSLIEAGKEEELIDSFYKDLEFGTGGLRGIMGVGTNRINKYTIAMATQGLSNYLLKHYKNEPIKVAIAHDSRNNSDLFAKVTAEVFAANGIKVYFFKALRPTPELSFAIRTLGCKSGVVLTASHNPKEYNGYKAYWEDGAQVIAPHDKNIIDEVQKIKSLADIRFKHEASMIEEIGEDIDELYLKSLKNLSVSPDAIARQHDLKIVYTPIHGTGVVLVEPILKRFGFTNITVVKEQAEPAGNGNFPTVVYPNPEEADALKLAVEKANAIGADLVMATDPDADRVGIAIRNNKGELQLLNGNQTGSLLIHYLLKAWKEKGQFKGNEFVVKTIVTTDLIPKIAAYYGVKSYETLTGFKYIAALIKKLEGKEQFIAGGEESYGYLIGDKVRDKDAIASCAIIAEMAAYAKDKGSSLYDTLLDTYVQFGYYKENLISLTKKGKTGAEEIQKMMKDLRETPPATLAGSKVIRVKDYNDSSWVNPQNGEKGTLDFPKENVLQFLTEDGSLISARPSGTEPKIKFYFSVNEPLKDKSQFEAVSKQLDQKIDRLVTELNIK
ncbi:MAG: pgm [Chitinophagaceae bacterium]|nr:pgm [Chitinophagaceae bacterium]